MMNADEFRRLGYAVVDWIADYHTLGAQGPVVPQVKPGDVMRSLEPHPPLVGENGDALFADFKDKILPGITHWNDPRFMGYFPCNNSLPSVLGEMLTAGLGVNTFSWITSPAGTELELLVMRWLGEMIGLPWAGVIQDTASTATLCALLSAREQVAPVNAEGLRGQRRLVCYVSDQTHSSVLKAARIAGIGDENVRVIPTDPVDFSMDVAALARAIDEDIRLGHKPFFVTPSVGTTATTAVDDVPAIVHLCRARDTAIWVHVDAALAGSAAVVPEMRWVMAGVEDADSFVFNPHKWMFTNFDCTAYFCKDKYKLKHALALTPEYLKTEVDDMAENLRDWGIQLGRRFRALKLWFVLRSFGVEGLQEKIRLHLALAQEFATRVKDHPRLQVVGEPRFNLVCFRLESDAATETLMAALNATGEIFLTHAKLGGRYVIRVSFGQTHSGWDTLEKLWSLLGETLRRQPRPA